MIAETRVIRALPELLAFFRMVMLFQKPVIMVMAGSSVRAEISSLRYMHSKTSCYLCD